MFYVVLHPPLYIDLKLTLKHWNTVLLECCLVRLFTMWRFKFYAGWAGLPADWRATSQLSRPHTGQQDWPTRSSRRGRAQVCRSSNGDELLANCPVLVDKERVVRAKLCRRGRAQVCSGSGDVLLANCPVLVNKEGVVRAEIRRRGKTSSGILRR